MQIYKRNRGNVGLLKTALESLWTEVLTGCRIYLYNYVGSWSNLTSDSFFYTASLVSPDKTRRTILPPAGPSSGTALLGPSLLDSNSHDSFQARGLPDVVEVRSLHITASLAWEVRYNTELTNIWVHNHILVLQPGINIRCYILDADQWWAAPFSSCCRFETAWGLGFDLGIHHLQVLYFESVQWRFGNTPKSQFEVCIWLLNNFPADEIHPCSHPPFKKKFKLINKAKIKKSNNTWLQQTIWTFNSNVGFF